MRKWLVCTGWLEVSNYCSKAGRPAVSRAVKHKSDLLFMGMAATAKTLPEGAHWLGGCHPCQ